MLMLYLDIDHGSPLASSIG